MRDEHHPHRAEQRSCEAIEIYRQPDQGWTQARRNWIIDDNRLGLYIQDARQLRIQFLT